MQHQEAVTVRAFIKPGAVESLEHLLRTVGDDIESNPLIPFVAFETVHFARLVILPETKDLKNKTIRPSLVYAANVDGAGDSHLEELVRVAGVGLDRIFSHCEDYPAAPDDRTRFGYLKSKRISTQAFYVNTVGRTARQVREEALLREELERELDRLVNLGATDDAAQVRARLQAFVRGQEGLARASRAAPQLPLGWRIRERLAFFGTLLLLLLLSPLLLLGLPFFLIILRMHEIRDAQKRKPLRISAEEQFVLRLNEDQVVQNQISAVGSAKPGFFRYATLRGDLGTVKLLKFYGVDTIHFAQWIVIDEGRRVLFFSNYDGSLVSYMDDFVNKVAWGLNAVFSNGNHYPDTRWLILDGAHDEQQFKAFLHKHQVPTQAWYSAHKRYTAINLSNNTEIRRGLFASGQRDAASWLARL
jgi:hypothetical protein